MHDGKQQGHEQGPIEPEAETKWMDKESRAPMQSIRHQRTIVGSKR